MDDLALLEQLRLPTLGIRRIVHRDGRSAVSILILDLTFSVFLDTLMQGQKEGKK